MSTCPYCKSEVDIDLTPPRMTKKQDMIYRDIVATGPLGLDHDELNKKYFAGRSSTTVRTCIHRINRVIAPLKIRCRGGSHFLT